MGPECVYCGKRCFEPFPPETPVEIFEAFWPSGVMATCPAGQRWDKHVTGYCYDDAVAAIREANNDEE